MSDPIALDDLTLADGELFHDRKGAPCPIPTPLAPLADTHGHLTSFREHDPAAALVRVTDTVEPERELAERYDERYSRFSKIYPACKELFAEIV